MSNLAKLQARIDAMRAQGLSDIQFSGLAITDCIAEDFAGEALAMLDAIEQGKAKPLRFNDSKQLTVRPNNLTALQAAEIVYARQWRAFEALAKI